MEKKFCNVTERPKEITCNKIWELYRFMTNMECPYVLYMDRADRYREKLYRVSVADVSLGTGERIYGYDVSGWELPTYDPEWVKFMICTYIDGQEKICFCKIELNSLYDHNESVYKLLEQHNIRVPAMEEINEYIFDEHGLPVGCKVV